MNQIADEGSMLFSEKTVTLERVKGIEPSYSAWEAAALPLSYTRISRTYVYFGSPFFQGVFQLCLRGTHLHGRRGQVNPT
jgi:hypothetical protein